MKADASCSDLQAAGWSADHGGGPRVLPRYQVSITNDLNAHREAAGSGLDGRAATPGARATGPGLFVEFNIPVVKDLELNLALRYDDYSDFGSTTNPKASLRWTPTKELLVRGSYQHRLQGAVAVRRVFETAAHDIRRIPGMTRCCARADKSTPLLAASKTATAGAQFETDPWRQQSTCSRNRQRPGAPVWCFSQTRHCC